MHKFSHLSTRNLLLSTLPKHEYERLLRNMEHFHLVRGKVLYGMGDAVRYAYFPISGMASVLSITEDGKATEIGVIGSEGMVGISIVLGFKTTPYQVVVQLSGDALRIRTDKLNDEFKRGGQLHDLLLRYTHTLLTQVSQSASCNCFHTVEARLCRWLLVSRDRARSETLHLTQEFLSQMIGVPRTSVTAIAGKLQKAGLVRYSRGKIQIINQQGLEAFSCECYRVLRERNDNFLAA